MKPDDEMTRWANAWQGAQADQDESVVAVAQRATRAKKLKQWGELALSTVTMAQLLQFGLRQQQLEWWLWCATAACLVVGFQVMAIRIRFRASQIAMLATDAALGAKLAEARSAMKLVKLNLCGTALLVPIILPLVISHLQQGAVQAAIQITAAQLVVISASLFWSRSVWRKNSATVRLLESLRAEP